MTEPTARTSTNIDPEVRLYYPTEAATLLRMGRSKVFELIRTGRLRSVKEGRARRIPAAALDEYVALLESEAQEEEAA